MNAAEPNVLFLALLLDLVLGDPRWLPHPVVMIGRLITFSEIWLRKTISNERFAGILLLAITVGASASATWLILHFAHSVYPMAGFILMVYVSYTCLAVRSLHSESALVANALSFGDIETARKNLSFIVGRDTCHLEEGEIWRALIETVAENTADGIIAPLFWLTVGGPVAGMSFKAVSTLDSMVGYRNERYRYFGWASARMDDLLNFIPARIAAVLMLLAAPLAGLSCLNSVKITFRDRLKHPSPNSGHPEAAAAGALGVRLGGAATYNGQASWKEHIGDSLAALDERSYRNMIRLMYTTALLMSAGCIAAAYLLRGLHVPHL